MLKLYQHDLTPAQYAAGQGVICTLPKAIAPEAPLTINGDWSLSFAYPVGSLAADELQLDRLVEADGQLYRIEDVEKIGSADGLRLQIHAVHLIYDLRRKHIVNIETAETTPGGISQAVALDQILHGTPFTRGTVDTDIVLDYLDILQKDAMWALKEQVLPLWGGELQPDNWTVNIRKKMGADRGAQLRYGKNIDGVRLKESLDGTITRLHILGYKNANIEPVNGGKDYIDSPNIGLYAQPIEGLVTFPDDDLPADLLSKGQAYLATVDTPRISMTVDLAKVRGSVQYRHYKDLERVELGDTVTVYHQRLKIDINARIQARTYNPVSGENIRVVLGNDDRNLYSHIASLQQAAEIIKMIADRKGHIRGERLRGVIDLLTTKLYASGAYTTSQVLEDKGVLLENTDEASVDYGALYAGPGIFAIASEKDNTGQWIWRTFGTGQGFVGHEIIAHTITANKLASDVGQQLDLSSNEAITQLVEDYNAQEQRLQTAEQKITPAAITATVRNHADYKSDLAGKNRTYLLATAPSGANAGDLWIDSANGNLLKRYNGSAWAAVQDGAISIAQQQADKIQWMVASGTSAANMTLTSQLYSLMAANIDLSANNSIKLAVSGGTNLIPYSDTSADILSYWSKWGNTPNLVKWNNDYIEFQEIAEAASGIVSPPFFLRAMSGDTLTLSFKAAHRDAAAILDYCYIIDPVNGNRSLSVLGAASVTTTGTTNSPRYTMTFTLDATYDHNIQILIATNDRNAGHRIIIGWPQLERGTMATDWSPAPSDPASGVKTSSVEVNSNGIYMDTTGTFNVNAGVGVNIKGGSGASSIGISNNDANNYFLWAGHGTPASAPFSVKRDGSVKATKIQHEMPYTFWDMADSSTPAEFPVYIPSGYTINSVTFTFQTKKARTFAKSAASGGGVVGTDSGGGTAGIDNIVITVDSRNITTTGAPNHTHSTSTDPSGSAGAHNHTNSHNHSASASYSMVEHTHKINLPGHTHGINYGINEKSTLATSCALKVGATTIGTYSPNPSNPVELKAHMSAGWNTVIVAPNNDARIVAFALVKLTPA